MTLQIPFFNVWALIVAILSNMILGALWYSPVLFGNTWLALVGKKAEDISKEDASKSMSFSIIPAIFTNIFLTLVLAFANAQTILDALIIGTLLSIGFIGMSAFNLVLFENRSVKLTILNVGYSIVSINIAALILTLWK